MSEPVQEAETIKLGEELELNPRLRELRRNGRVLKIERIPMELLLLLVQQRGEIVSRHQIVETIWGGAVSFDSNNSINGAIRKIRQALRDNPEQPRFIQTVTGAGYRFIAPAIDPAPESRPAVAQSAPPDGGSPGWPPWLRWALIAAPVLVLLAAMFVLLGRTYYRARAVPVNEKIMLAVLPFRNLTGDAKEDDFSDGLTDEVITRLGSLEPEQLGVIALSSVMGYKGRHAQIGQIARELGVQYLLEGSVRRSSGRIRITAHLIQARDRTELWARAYDRVLLDLLEVQIDVGREIADQIQLALAGAGKKRSTVSSQ